MLFFLNLFCKISKLNFPSAPVILISMDTTRADHLSCYGYKHKTTPNIDSLANDGIIFKNVISQVPLTLPSHSSILTGKYPFNLNIKDNGGYFLSNSEITLPEILSQNNYITAGIIGAFVLHSKWGISQGFQFYDDDVSIEAYQVFSLISIDRPANVVLDKTINWLNNFNKSVSFFLFIHFFDAHAPYRPHPEFNLPNNYDAEIAFMDYHIGKIIDLLKKNNLYKKSLIIAFGDHGEGLGEHGENAHGLFLYDSTLKVPLIIKLPHSVIKNRTINQQVQLVDIMPTILDIVSVKSAAKIDGISLTKLIVNNAKDNLYNKRYAYSETYFPLLHYGWSPLFSARTNNFKFIKAPKSELYNLIEDNEEKINIISAKKDIAIYYEKFIDKYAQSLDNIALPSNISGEDEEKLKALGYSSFYRHNKLQKVLPDPKDKLPLFQALELAKETLDKKDFEAAISNLNYVINNDSNVIEAWFVLGNSFAHLKNYNSAIDAFLKAYALNPNNVYIIFNLAHAYQKINNFQEALLWYQKAIALDNKFFKALLSAGEISFFLHKYDLALNYFLQALKFKNDMPEIYNYLTGIYIAKNDFTNAKKYVHKAYSMNPNLPFLNFYLALIYEKEEQIDKAINYYKKELQINPTNLSAMNNLGLSYIANDNYSSAEKIFRNLIQLNPNEAKYYLLLANVLMRKNGNKNEIQMLLSYYKKLKNSNNLTSP